ncbi:hypothetical protein OH76DRAFT_518280 [Lentinus brumalis]|uniref:F-box domain-containing protein n=1 Tax=Lentinus brumalis TaxID=2498619 RepID=A0A371DAM3_9APHY|nr:hypothetical protein OH76DRAFT_518280 [Polyporus brumalis]
MDNSLLPIQVCETIIDSCDRSFVDYTTLRSCALTCTAWLPRSQLNLYHSVKLIGPRKLELLLQTLRAHRYLCGFVRELEVGSFAEQPYVPFAQLFIVQNLRNLERLTLWLDWDGYPPHFYKFVAQLRLRTLRLFGIFRTTRDLLQLVWALKGLRSLVVDCTVRNDGRGAEWAIGRSRRLSLCSSLTDLSLRFSGSRPIVNFPLPGGFGHAVAHLQLHFDRAPSPGDPSDFACLMSCISEFTVLKTLEVTDVLGTQAHVGLTCKAEFLTRLLDSISADAPFRFFHLRLASYGTLQPAVLCDELFTDDVRFALQRVSALVRFDLTVECASAEQRVQDLSAALQLWFSKARLPVQICHSMVVLYDHAEAHWSCSWTQPSPAALAQHPQSS